MKWLKILYGNGRERFVNMELVQGFELVDARTNLAIAFENEVWFCDINNHVEVVEMLENWLESNNQNLFILNTKDIIHMSHQDAWKELARLDHESSKRVESENK